MLNPELFPSFTSVLSNARDLHMHGVQLTEVKSQELVLTRRRRKKCLQLQAECRDQQKIVMKRCKDVKETRDSHSYHTLSWLFTFNLPSALSRSPTTNVQR